MAESHVLSALIAKHKELGGQVQHYQTLIKALSQDLGHVEATIKVFDPEYNIKGISPKRGSGKKRLFKPRECQVLVLDLLRQAEAVLTTKQVVQAIQDIKHFEPEHSKQLHNTVSQSLRHASITGQVEHAGKTGTQSQWCIAQG